MPSPMIKITAIKPKRFTFKPVSEEIQQELDRWATYSIKELSTLTSSWKEPVQFQSSRAGSGGLLGFLRSLVKSTSMAASVSTDNDVFNIVNQGSPPHVIQPRQPMSKSSPMRPSALKFQIGYRAKTRRRSLQSGGGGPFGPTVMIPGVLHPGFEGRDFYSTLAEKLIALMPEGMRVAISRGIQRGVR